MLKIARQTIGFVLLFCFATSAFTLNPSRRITQYGHTAWRVQDGVFSGKPTAVAQTKDGYIWIGTEAGLIRFDGIRFLPWIPPPGMQLRSSIILSLLAARDGSLWIGTASGLSHWANGELFNFPGPIAYINSILETRDGTVWVTRSRITDWSGPFCQIVETQLRCYGKADGISTVSAAQLVEDAQGNLWIGGAGALLEWKTGLSRSYPLKGLKDNDVQHGVEGVALAHDDSLWIGVDNVGQGMGLERFVHGQWEPFLSPALKGSTLAVLTLFVDRDDALWVGTLNKGIYRIHGERVDHFGREDGLSSDTVLNFYEDHEGDIWAVTSEGVENFRSLSVATFSTHEGLSGGYSLAVLARRDGTVWNSNLGALDVLHNGDISSIGVNKGLPGRFPASMLEDHSGQMWVGVDGGLFVYRHGHFRPIIQVDRARNLSALAEDLNGAVWAEFSGSSTRLVRIENFKIQEEILPPKVPPVFSILADPRGGIWLSPLGGGLAHYERGRLQIISMSSVENPGTHVGGLFNLFLDSDGTLWGAAAGGLVGYRQGKLQLLTERDGLACNHLYSIVEDVKKGLWFYSLCGLSMIERSEINKWWDNPDYRIHVKTFDVSDGVRSGHATGRPGAGRSPDGRLWFSNGSSIQTIDPDHIAMNFDPPPVHIEQFIAEGKNYSVAGQPHLPPLPREIEIDYTALSYQAPQKVRFRYKLEGRDTDWQEPGTRRQAFYNDLPPGNYHFRVIACNNSGVWNEAGASLIFSVAPTWYQTNGFRIACLGAFLTLAWGLYQLRLQQLHRQFNVQLEARLKERARIAQDLHDTFFQGIQGLLLRFHTATSQLGKDDPARQAFEETLKQSDQVMLEGRELVLDLRAAVSEQNDLPAAFADFGEGMRSSSSCEFKVVVNGTVRPLHPVVFEEVFKLGKEALGNAFRHSGAHSIETEVNYEPHELRIRIRDDGSGIDSAILQHGHREGHFGLPGMKERAKKIHAHLDVWSRTGAGTEVELRIAARIAYVTAIDGSWLWKLRQLWHGTKH